MAVLAPAPAVTDARPETARAVAAYLDSTGNNGSGYVHFNVRPVRVTIGTQTWAGAEASRVVEITPGCRAWTEGRRHDVARLVYVAGTLPKGYLRSTHVAYTRAGDPCEWYLASYYPAIERHRQGPLSPDASSEYHPFGASFMLFPWDVDGKIDQYERRPYERLPLTVEYLDREG